MANKTKSMVTIYDELFKEGYRYDFFQASWLFERYFGIANNPRQYFDLHATQIFYRPHSGLIFPPTDIRRIERSKLEHQERVELVLTFLGLYGVGSPLPVYFYDDIATEADWVQPYREFLDIFNHRLYEHYYRAWKKYQPTLQANENKIDKHSERFYCLTGLGEPDRTRETLVHPMRLAAFAGRLVMRTRNAESLRMILGTFFEKVSVLVQQNIPRWVELSERLKMGHEGREPMKLGLNVTLGKRIFDITGKFRIIMKGVTLREFLGLLPGGELEALFRYIVELYAPDGLSYDVQLEMNSQDFPKLKLGDKMLRMGLTSYLGRPTKEVLTKVVAYK